MKLVIGSDHRGYGLVNAIVEWLRGEKHAVEIVGPHTEESSDYPDAAHAVGRAVAGGRAELGLLVCGSANGVCIAANKVPGVRAGIGLDPEMAEMARRHNHANVLCLSGDRTDIDGAKAIIAAWMSAEPEGGRHARRVEMMEKTG